MNEQQDHSLISERMETPIEDRAPRERTRPRSAWIVFTSLCFILLQSACTAVMAVSGLRLIIGVGSLAFATTGLKFLASLHADAIRIPMMVIAGVGSMINLYVVWRIRSLRARSSSSWRSAPVAPGKRREENVQLALAIATLLLIIAELIAHAHLHEGRQ